MNELVYFFFLCITIFTINYFSEFKLRGAINEFYYNNAITHAKQYILYYNLRIYKDTGLSTILNNARVCAYVMYIHIHYTTLTIYYAYSETATNLSINLIDRCR